MYQVTQKETSQARWHIVIANVMNTNEVSVLARLKRLKMWKSVTILNGKK